MNREKYQKWPESQDEDRVDERRRCDRSSAGAGRRSAIRIRPKIAGMTRAVAVRRAEDLVDEGVDVIEERAVVGGVVAPVASARKRPGLVGVDRLVVMERPVAERPEARRDGEGGEQEEARHRAARDPLPRARDGSRVVQGVLPSFSRAIEPVPELTT